MTYQECSKEELASLLEETKAAYEALKAKGMKLDMSRGKPSEEQLNFSNGMFDLFTSSTDFRDENGVDVRNYGNLDAMPEANRLFAALLGVGEDEVIVGGSSSLTLMHDAISRAVYWQGDPNRGVNQGAVNFLRSLNHGLNKRWPTGIYMAEDSTNFLKVTAPTRYDGVGFDYKWDMGWMHDTLDYFATPFGERPNAYGKLLFSMHYFYNELYLLALSHDEVVHGKKTIIDKLWGTYAEKCAQLRTLYFYMYMHPGKKLNFMGNELGHFREWDEKRELDWDLLKYPFHDAFQKYFARLSLVYATEPALFDGEYNPDCFEWVASESCTEGVYAWLRKGRGQNLLCIMNTQDHAHKKFPLYLKFPCSAELVLDTEAAEWGGAHKGRRKLHFHTTDGGVYGRDYTLTVDLPAMGSFLLRLTPEAPNPDAARISANKAMAQKRRTARAKNSSK